MKHDMTPLTQKRARRRAQKEVDRARKAQLEFDNRSRAGRRVFAFVNPGDHAAGERIQDYVKNNGLYLEAIINPRVMDRFEKIIEEGEHVDIALLTNANTLSIAKLFVLLFSCSTGNVKIHLLGQCNRTRRVLITALN